MKHSASVLASLLCLLVLSTGVVADVGVFKALAAQKKAVGAVTNVIGTKIEGKKSIVTAKLKQTAKSADKVSEADAKVLKAINDAAEHTLKHSGHAVSAAAMATAVGIAQVNPSRPPLGGFFGRFKKVTTGAKVIIESKHVVGSVKTGVKKVDHAIDKAHEVKLEALEDVKKAAERAARKAELKTKIAKAQAGKALEQAKKAIFHAVLHP